MKSFASLRTASVVAVVPTLGLWASGWAQSLTTPDPALIIKIDGSRRNPFASRAPRHRHRFSCTLILIGARDDWTPSKDCEEMVARRQEPRLP
jgi:hypothetical protein